MEFIVVSSRRATPAEKNAAAQIAQMRWTQLATVRATAENWRNGIGAATTASTAVTFLAAPAALKVSTPANIVNGGWLLGIALIIATVSVGLALRASFGWPKQINVTTMDAIRQWEDEELITTVRMLRTSMILSVVALALLGVSGAVLIFQVPLPFTLPSWE